MGCLIPQKKIEDKITPQDFKIIWNKCLNTDSIVLTTSKKKHHPVFQQIAKDIDRTYPGHPFFNSPENKKSFERVLKAFALEFPKIGYTQGLNFLAGFLLISGFSQQQSLKTLIAMCIHPELMLIGLYEDDFPLCKLNCSLFWLLTKKLCPAAYEALKAANLPDELWIFQWFITFFIYSFPLSYIQQFLNFIVVKRYFASVRLAVAVVQCLEKQITGIGGREDGFLECFELIKTQEFCKKFLPLDQIIKKAEKVKKETVFACLHQSRENNWYRLYFSLKSPDWEKKYRKMLETLQQQRQNFAAENDLSLRYTRLASSMNVIDSIEQSMVKMYEKRLFRSSYDRNTVFFSNMSIKRYNSLDLIASCNSK